MTIGWIRQKVESDDYELSSHAEEERQDEEILIADIEHALLAGEVIEQYLHDPRGPSCLVLGYGQSGYPIHAVVGRTTTDRLRIITIYIPSPPKWMDPKTRSKR